MHDSKMTAMLPRILGLMLGLAWLMASAELGRAQRFGSGATGSLNSSRLNTRAGTNRQGNSGLRTGGSSSRSGRTRGAGQPVGPGDQTAQPQGREFQERAFVGRDAEDVRNTFRNLSRGQRRRTMMEMAVENLNEMRESRKRWQDQQRQPPSVRVQLRPAFDYPAVAADRVVVGMQSRLASVMGRTGDAAPSVELKGRTVTLRGSVRSEHEKALAGQLVAIEPGVSQVNNLLIVAEKR